MIFGHNLISNPGMENGNPPTGWTALYGPDTFERSAVIKHGGSFSAHIVEGNPTGNGGMISNLFTSVIGKKYSERFWYHIVSGSLLVQYNNGAGTPFTFSLLNTTGSLLYSELIVEEDVGGSSSAITFYSGGTGATEFYIDDVSVQEVIKYKFFSFPTFPNIPNMGGGL